MKKLVISLVVLVSVLVAFSVTANAQEKIVSVTAKEKDVLTQLMEIREIGGNISTEVLYDHNDNPEFIMGTTKTGYLIMGRHGYACLEWGTGNGPYSGFSDDKKYYGGILCYFVDSNGSYFNIVTKEKTKEISYLGNFDTLLASYSASDKEKTMFTPKSNTLTKKISNNYGSIRRLAFGNNVDGTCSAVAFGIVLNYIDREVNTLCVPNNMESETLYGQDQDLTKYTQAQRLHEYLYDDCEIIVNAFGPIVMRGMDIYRRGSTDTSNLEIACDYYALDQSERIIDIVDNDEAAMLSTGLLVGPPYGAHSMAFYGYREYSDNTYEVLVHTGWYTDIDAPNNIINEVWIPVDLVFYTYRFYYATPLDTSAPVLAVNPTNPTTMKLEWAEVTGAEYYEIYRSDVYTGPYGLIETVDRPALTYEDSGLDVGETYYYKIKACKVNMDDLVIESEFSNIMSVQYILPAPQMSSVTSSSNSITCTWTSVDDAAGYELYRATNPTETYEKIASLTGAETVTYVDTSLSGGTTYYYKVRAYATVDGEDIYSEYSNVHSATASIFTYDLNPDNTLTITGYLGSNPDIVIPTEINQKTVTAIGSGTFASRALTSVVIPNSITRIDARAFRLTTGLTNIAIPNGVTSIGEAAFQGSSITSIVLSNSLTEISANMFNSSKLTSIIIPDSVTSIGTGAFSNCFDLSDVTLSSNLTNIGDGAFTNTTSLTHITLPNSITNIGQYAFVGSNLTSINLPSSLTTINAGAFISSKLTSIVMPNSITSIGEGAFNGCSDLTTITFSNNITHIGDNAFYNCSKLENASIPECIQYIGMFAFKDCTGLSSLNIETSSPDCVIGDHAFNGCTGLTSVTIDTVGSIGEWAFYGCNNITQVDLSNVKNIGMQAFAESNSLEEVNLSNTDVIGDYVFNVCASLEEVSITNSGSIGSYAFYGCTNLISANIGADEIGERAFLGCQSLSDLNLANGIETIADAAFQDCNSLLEVDIPNSVTNLGSMAFFYCTSLTRVLIPGSVQDINPVTFAGCSSLCDVTLGEGIVNIMGAAFADCTALTQITIPSSVTYIDETAFQGSGVEL